MATIVGTVYLSGCNYQVGYDLLGQNTAGNYSTVRFYGILNVTGTYVAWSRGTATVWNSPATGLSTRYNRGSYTVVTQDVNIGHDSQGKYSGILTGTLNTTFVSGTASGAFELPPIKRIAVTNSAVGGVLEDNFKVNFTKYVDNYTYKLRISVPHVKELEKINYQNSGVDFKLTQTTLDYLYTYTKNSNNVKLGFAVETWDGNSIISSGNEIIITGKIVNANPIFTDFSFEDINPDTIALTNDNQVNINGYSNIKVTVSPQNKATAQKNATMNKYQLSVAGNDIININYSDTSAVVGTVMGAKQGIYNLYAIDSRNNSTLITKTATNSINYTNISVNQVNSKATRDENGVGYKCNIYFEGEFWNGDFGAETNNLTNITYKFKKTTDTQWITGTGSIEPTINENKFSFSGNIKSNNSNPDNWDLDSNYNIQIVINDKLSYVTINLILNSAIPTLALAKNGVGIMGKYDDNIGGLLQVGGNIIDSGKLSWINPNPTNTIDTMEITIDDEYDTYAIIWKQTTNSEYYFNTGQILKGYGTILIIPNNHYRTIDSSYNGIKINAAVDESRYCIPLYIITYKMNLLRDISNTINIEEE